jgi:hypothetical protein
MVESRRFLFVPFCSFNFFFVHSSYCTVVPVACIRTPMSYKTRPAIDPLQRQTSMRRLFIKRAWELTRSIWRFVQVLVQQRASPISTTDPRQIREESSTDMTRLVGRFGVFYINIKRNGLRRHLDFLMPTDAIFGLTPFSSSDIFATPNDNDCHCGRTTFWEKGFLRLPSYTLLT